jgi:peptidoglycan/xylan/chitin deacetylase (PgdA/CDA1 family)
MPCMGVYESRSATGGRQRARRVFGSRSRSVPARRALGAPAANDGSSAVSPVSPATAPASAAPTSAAPASAAPTSAAPAAGAARALATRKVGSVAVVSSPPANAPSPATPHKPHRAAAAVPVQRIPAQRTPAPVSAVPTPVPTPAPAAPVRARGAVAVPAQPAPVPAGAGDSADHQDRTSLADRWHAVRGRRAFVLIALLAAVATSAILVVAVGLPSSEPKHPKVDPGWSDGAGRALVAASYSSPSGEKALMSLGSKAMSLTIDDGPDPQYTPGMLNLLREQHITAVFCLVGKEAEKYPELVRRIVADGHALCNHSYAHDLSLGRRGQDQITTDLDKTSKAIEKASGGVRPQYFRAPGGNWTPQVIQLSRAAGMVPLGWDTDTRDWTKPGVEAIKQVVLAAQPGAIILCHDAGGDRTQTLEALTAALPVLVGKKQKFVFP